jgi:hypothetical protein
MRYETFINGEWVEQAPTETGQRYRLHDDAGGVLESYWSELVPVQPPRHISKLKFKQRMTTAERIAIRAAAETTPEVYDFMDLLSDATFADLDDPTLISGVNALEPLGLLAAGRASEILNAPIQPHEVYNG